MRCFLHPRRADIELRWLCLDWMCAGVERRAVGCFILPSLSFVRYIPPSGEGDQAEGKVGEVVGMGWGIYTSLFPFQKGVGKREHGYHPRENMLWPPQGFNSGSLCSLVEVILCITRAFCFVWGGKILELEDG